MPQPSPGTVKELSKEKETVEEEEHPDLVDTQEPTWQNLRALGSGGGKGDGNVAVDSEPRASALR